MSIQDTLKYYKDNKQYIQEAKTLCVILFSNASYVFDVSKINADLLKRACNDFRTYGGIKVLIPETYRNEERYYLGKSYERAKYNYVSKDSMKVLDQFAEENDMEGFVVASTPLTWDELCRVYCTHKSKKQTSEFTEGKTIELFLETWSKYEPLIKIKSSQTGQKGYKFDFWLEDLISKRLKKR